MDGKSVRPVVVRVLDRAPRAGAVVRVGPELESAPRAGRVLAHVDPYRVDVRAARRDGRFCAVLVRVVQPPGRTEGGARGPAALVHDGHPRAAWGVVGDVTTGMVVDVQLVDVPGRARPGGCQALVARVVGVLSAGRPSCRPGHRRGGLTGHCDHEAQGDGYRPKTCPTTHLWSLSRGGDRSTIRERRKPSSVRGL